MAMAATGAVVSTVLAPSAPRMGAPPPMPDQAAVTQAAQLKEAQMAAQRQGRLSTVLTTPATTGDKLGP